jgi:parallel beta-helix repeat protein
MLVALCAYVGAQEQLPLTAGMVIDHSITVKPGTYRLPSANLDAPAIVVRGANITIDLTGVTIEGGEPYADPDGYTGVGILVDGAANVTIKGGAVRGYKVGIRASKTPKLHITGVDASYNYKQHLWSGIEKESLLDWMSYHQNEKDEWLRYGAAIYLTDCDDCEVDNSTAIQGENGLMLTRVNHSRVWNNTFSWNSALGLAMYRASDNAIMHNRLDWDVRGYSHGFYYRGQDSSAILIYEQSNRNQFGFNSATHGGDGVFLWAGQSTMDTGQGGANDNNFYGNDFSHAVANGIEATFSRNVFDHNRVDDCWHSVWGGYSFDSVFTFNSFAGSTDGIAIEHGQNNVISGNTFSKNDTAIRLWANLTQDPSWGYAKARDTRSRGYKIHGNTFDGNKLDISTLRTDAVDVDNEKHPPIASPPPPMPNGMKAVMAPDARQGRSTIIVDEWGPYDYKSPKLWPIGKPWERPLKLRVLGPAGNWTLKSIRGGTTDAKGGVIAAWPQPATEITVTPAGAGTDLELALEYVGGEVISPRGHRTPAGQPYTFIYRLFEPAANWTVNAWTFDEAADPIAKPDAFAARLKAAPTKIVKPARIDFMSGGVFQEGLPRDRVALVATGDVKLAGDVTMDVISDDGIRVWVDGKLVIDKWSVHESELDHAKLIAGKHHIKIEYFEQTGWQELQVRFRRD